MSYWHHSRCWSPAPCIFYHPSLCSGVHLERQSGQAWQSCQVGSAVLLMIMPALGKELPKVLSQPQPVLAILSQRQLQALTREGGDHSQELPPRLPAPSLAQTQGVHTWPSRPGSSFPFLPPPGEGLCTLGFAFSHWPWKSITLQSSF